MVLADARLKTVPLTATFWVVRGESERPLLIPLEASPIATVPLTTPALLVWDDPPNPTLIAVLMA